MLVGVLFVNCARGEVGEVDYVYVNQAIIHKHLSNLSALPVSNKDKDKQF